MKANNTFRTLCETAEQHRICVWARTDPQRHMIQRRRDAQELIRVFGNLHARPTHWNTLPRHEQYRRIIRSLATQHPNWIFCGMTAAALYGVNTSQRYMDTALIATSRHSHVRDYSNIRHLYLRDHTYVIVDGVRVTPLDRTIFDCVRHLSLPDGLAVLEATLREQLCTKTDLMESFTTLPGKKRAAALRALTHATGRTENGGEAFAYGVMVEAGYAPPDLQVEIPHPDNPMRVDRVDFAWRTNDGRLIVGELDGRVKYKDSAMYVNGNLPDTVIAEKEREERIQLTADVLFRFSFFEALQREPLIRKMNRYGVPRAG